jgi:hypothetical protein
VHAEHVLRGAQRHVFIEGVQDGGFEDLGVDGTGALGRKRFLQVWQKSVCLFWAFQPFLTLRSLAYCGHRAVHTT